MIWAAIRQPFNLYSIARNLKFYALFLNLIKAQIDLI